jgi:glycine/D-amino acid oxidase-like deaminating enzyme
MGVSCAVVEAGEIGAGASGRNNGQVIPTMSRADPSAMVARFGKVRGERFAGLVRDSAQILFDLVRRHAIDCAAEQSGWVQPAHSPGRVEKVARRRFEEWRALGAPVELLDRQQTAALLGSDAWFGAWLNRTGGHINPLAFARGLARAALGTGAAIFTGSPAQSIERAGDGAGRCAPGGSSSRPMPIPMTCGPASSARLCRFSASRWQPSPSPTMSARSCCRAGRR